MKYKCKSCKSELDIPMYCYDEQIIVERYPYDGGIDYYAQVRCKAICPICGYQIEEIRRKIIPHKDIIKLVTEEL